MKGISKTVEKEHVQNTIVEVGLEGERYSIYDIDLGPFIYFTEQTTSRWRFKWRSKASPVDCNFSHGRTGRNFLRRTFERSRSRQQTWSVASY